MKVSHALVLFLYVSLPTFIVVSACTPQEAKTVVDTTKMAVKVADDVCTELADAGPTPDWVTLLCNVVDKADKIRILMPRSEWHTIRARSSRVDAGPGK